MSQFKIFVGNLNFKTSKDTLREVFGTYGTVMDVSIPVYHDTRRPKGFAFVAFDNAQAAQAALKFSGEIDGREVRINTAAPEKKSPTHSEETV